MNPATRKHEDSVVEAMLYMALELSNKTWRVTFGDGARRRQVSVPAGDLAKLREALSQAKERFGLPALTPVVSCYEAGRDGFWLHRCLVSMGIDNVVVDSSSIEVNRRKRRATTDRIDGEQLLGQAHALSRGGAGWLGRAAGAQCGRRRRPAAASGTQTTQRERGSHQCRIQALWWRRASSSAWLT